MGGWYNPATLYSNAGFKAPFNIENLTATFRRWFAWQDIGLAVPSVINLTATGIKVLQVGSGAGVYPGWHQITMGYDGVSLYIFNEGVKYTLVTDADLGGSSAIRWFSDIYGDGSITNDEITRAFVSSGIIPSTCELFYLSVGGSPGVIRPASPTALITYLRLATDTLDYSANAYTQTATAVTNTADPAGLLPETLASITTPGKLTAAFHKDDGGTGFDFTLFMGDATDTTGSAWQFRACYYAPPSGHVVHDPSIALISGAVWIAYIPHNGGADSYFDIALFSDQYTGAFVFSPDCSSVTGSGAGKRTFKPTFFIDPASGIVYIMVGLSNDALASMKPYILTQVTPGDFTNWSAPALITITAQPAVSYDFFPMFKDGFYWIFYTDQATAKVNLARSSTFAGTYATVVTDVFGATAEGTKVIVRPSDGKIVAYMDVFGTEEKYSVSTGTTLSAATVWSAPADITINGITSAPGHFNAAGFSAVVGPALAIANAGRMLLLGVA